MFEYSKAALGIIVDDLKRLIRVISTFLSIGIYAYLICAIIFQIGFLVANIILISTKVLYDIISNLIFKDKTKDKAKKKIIKRSYTWTKLGINFITIALSMVNMALYSTQVSAIAIISTTLLIIMWVLQVLFEVVTFIFEQKSRLLIAGIQRDVKPIKATVNHIMNLLNMVQESDKKEEIVDYEKVYKKEYERLDKAVPVKPSYNPPKINISPLDILKKVVFKKNKKDNDDYDSKVG